MAQFPTYSFLYIEQIKWFQTFKEIIFDKVRFLYDDYNYYMKYPTSRLLNKTYVSIVNTMHELNQYIANVTQYIRSEERLYPNMTHKKTLEFVQQMADDYNSQLNTINIMYNTLHKLYKNSLPDLSIMIDRLERHVLQPDQERFCIH